MVADFNFAGRELKSQPLCIARFDVGVIMPLNSPLSARRVGYITGGRFEGPRLSGEVLPGGGNWPLSAVLPDGSAFGTFDARCCWQTDDGAVIYVTYTGRSLIPPDVGEAFRDPAQPHVDPSRYQLHIAMVFETADPRYAWLNAVLAVSQGEREPGGVRHILHAIG